MKFKWILQNSIEECIKACEVAALAARKDSSTANMRLKPFQDDLEVVRNELLYFKKILERWGHLPLMGNYWRKKARLVAKKYEMTLKKVNIFKTESEKNLRDFRDAKTLSEDFRNILNDLPLDFPGNLSSSLHKNVEAVKIKATFLMQNSLHIPSRRRDGLQDMVELSIVISIILADAKQWKSLPPTDNTKPTLFTPRKLSGAIGTAKKQITMDFSGKGEHKEVSRIWLPVPQSRMREIISMGARYDPEAPQRGSKLWVPVDESAQFDALLPLAFRSKPTHFSYPPIRHGAVGQNLGKVFDRESWNRIRNNAYDRTGHRCEICGKQFGNMWSRLNPKTEQKKAGPVDCHEVWDWTIPDGSGMGVQKLKRLLVVCKDCHMTFHEGFALFQGREVGIEKEVKLHIEKLRMLTNRISQEVLKENIAQDKQEWENNKHINKWVIDLSHIAAQSIMADHTLVLDPNNQAGMTEDMIGGTKFISNGVLFDAVDAQELATGGIARIAEMTQGRKI